MSTSTTKHVATARRIPRWGFWVAGVAGALIIGAVIVTSVAYASQSRTVVRHTTVAGQNLGGLDSLAALNATEKAWADFSQRGLTFVTPKQETVTIPVAGTVNSDTETVIEMVSFDARAAADAAYAFGHQGSLWRQIRERTSGWLGRTHQFGTVAVATAALRDSLQKKISSELTAPKDASISISANGAITVTNSSAGTTVNYQQATQTAVQQARSLNFESIPLAITTAQPAVPYSAELKAIAEKEVPSILARAPITLHAGDATKTIDKKILGGLLGFVRLGDTYVVGFDRQALAAYVAGIAQDINTDPQNARFAIANGVVTAFATSNTGRTVDLEASATAINQAVMVKKINEATLVIKETKPESETVPTNAFGITELVGEGTTNFRGSPMNRRYNLTLGAKLLNGLLIKPGEDFSLVQALGEIDAAHGWKPELVIKGTDIKPEFGGGLCQVGTTLFRAILNAGLPVLERHNHSLRIRYYEPPVGLDATIYDPSPDLRFKNDYEHYLLLQTSVDGDNITFRFYGTKDARTVDLPTPKVYNFKPIPPQQNIETTDLKPGEKKCQTPGHPGADATAIYTVTYADGHQNKQVFQSHYRPLPVICQVGVKKKKAPAKPKTTTNTNTAPAANTNTPEATNGNTNATANPSDTTVIIPGN